MDCDTEPDIDGPEWEDWWETHSADYCDGWRTLADQIVAWMAKHARFDLQNATAQPRRPNHNIRKETI